jgi:thioredoxin reductase (NADPH)
MNPQALRREVPCAIELLDTSRQQRPALAVRGLFVFIGARPATGWLAGQLAEDARGFLLTGTDIPQAQLDDAGRMPLFLETSRPGVFAAGDVRSGSVKRTATAIGEGSMAVRLVFERLQATGSAVADPPRADTGGLKA